MSLPAGPGTPSAGPLLELHDVSRTFGGFTAVDGVSLTVDEGEVLGIAGPNGAGKTTLFNLVTGVPFGPTAGTVSYAGERVDDLPAFEVARRGLRRTFQAEQLFPALTVEENVGVSARYLSRGRLRRKQARREVGRALELVALSASASAPAAEISLLEKKKLMIATALVASPRLLMLDEPAGGLNEEDQEHLVALLRTLRASGLTLVVIEHVLGVLRAVSDRLAVMAAGQVLVDGPPGEVLADPRVVDVYLGHAGAA